jgi:glucose/mannose-6-phosphate isomerase
MSLDDAEGLRRIDQSDLLSMMDRTPVRLAPPVDAESTCHGRFGKLDNILFGGVGGSGIVGDILSDYCRGSTEIPASVCRTLTLPKFVGKRTLFIVISYSGETLETLVQLTQAMKHGARIIAVTSGGRLLSKAEARGIPYLKIPSALPPRIALPELVAATVYAIGSVDMVTNVSSLLSRAADSLAVCIGKVKQSVPTQDNSAKQMAQALLDKLPLLIGDEAYGSVIRRFKNELNENAKVPAICYALPESYHNDIEALKSLAKLSKPQPILLRTQDNVESQELKREQLIRLLTDLNFPPTLEFEGVGKERLSQLLSAITFADYVSVYLAALSGVDPAELTHIPAFRATASGR